MFGLIGMTGDDIYRNFRDGKGPAGLIDGATIVNDIAGTYESRAQQIRALVGRMESAWQGDAAGAAQRGAGPLAVEHEMSGMALGTAQDLTGRQAGSFGEAKGRVVPVPPKPEMQNPAAVFTDPAAVIDHERQVDDYNAAAQNNVDVMNGYSGASEYNTTNLPASYGALSDDQAGLGIDTDGTTIDSADDTGGGSGGDTGRDTGGSPSGGDRAPGGSPVTGPERSVPPGPGTSSPGAGSAGPASVPTPDTTTPETFVPGQTVSPTDPGAGRVPGGPTGTPSPGLGAVTAGPGGFGSTGGSPRGGASPAVGAGPLGGAGPRGSAARSGPAGGPLAGTGRGGAAAGGFPMGAAGRGRDGEDTEHKRPEWLEGGDPDELFDTDVLTAPPTIGAEDD